MESRECPRSAITAESAQLVTEILQAGWIHKSTGVYPGAASMDDWDVSKYDAVLVCEIEQSRTREAQREATK